MNSVLAACLTADQDSSMPSHDTPDSTHSQQQTAPPSSSPSPLVPPVTTTPSSPPSTSSSSIAWSDRVVTSAAVSTSCIPHSSPSPEATQTPHPTTTLASLPATTTPTPTDTPPSSNSPPDSSSTSPPPPSSTSPSPASPTSPPPPSSNSPPPSPPPSPPSSPTSPAPPSITLASTTPPDSTTPDDAAKKEEKSFREELEDGFSKLREMTAWSTPSATQIVKGIGGLYWKVLAHEQVLLGDTFCELEGAELFRGILLSLTKEGLFSSNPAWQTTFYIYNTLWNFSDASLTLSLRLGQVGMVKLCATNISHKPYRDNLAQKNVMFLIKASLNILHNLAKAPGNRHVYREEGVVEKMEPYLEGDPYLKAICMMTLAYIVEEGQEEILAGKGTNTIEYLVDVLKDARNSADNRSQGLSDTEVAAALGRLAVHDNNKHKIVETGGLPLMVSMLHDSSVESQEAATRAVWNLAFSDDVSDKLRADSGCMETLQGLANSDTVEVAKAARGALWVINKEGEKKDEEKEESEKEGASSSRGSSWTKQQHIMISYQWGCQPMVLKMRDALANAGYKIWVDVDCMYGSTLQAMAEAIENACAVVMCMSERYKESPNCRTEAEYAFQLRKRIIPVMMEEFYRPDGWLGIILGAKFYMDFSGRLSLDEEMAKLLKEVEMHGKEAKIVRDDTDEGLIGATITFPLESAGISSKMECLDWTTAQVQDWLSENELEHLRPVMAEYNGRLLIQLHKMREDAPDFFYRSIKEDFKLLRLVDVLRFTEVLDTLIKD